MIYAVVKALLNRQRQTPNITETKCHGVVVTTPALPHYSTQ